MFTAAIKARVAKTTAGNLDHAIQDGQNVYQIKKLYAHNALIIASTQQKAEAYNMNGFDPQVVLTPLGLTNSISAMSL
jgi:hypothetical protein